MSVSAELDVSVYVGLTGSVGGLRGVLDVGNDATRVGFAGRGGAVRQEQRQVPLQRERSELSGRFRYNTRDATRGMLRVVS